MTSPASAKNRNTHRSLLAARGFVPRRLSYAYRRPKLFTMPETLHDSGPAVRSQERTWTSTSTLYAGHTRDRVYRAISIATGRRCHQVYDELNAPGNSERRSKRRRHRSSARTGVRKTTMRHYLASLRWRWVPTMKVGQSWKVHLRGGELPSGRIIVSVSRHLCAVIAGVIHDTYDPSRNGTRCVYRYWVSPEAA